MQSVCLELERQFTKCTEDLDIIAKKLDHDFDKSQAYKRVWITQSCFIAVMNACNFPPQPAMKRCPTFALFNTAHVLYAS